MYIETRKTPNQTEGRAGNIPIAIVIHVTEGIFPGLDCWLKNPNSRASYHYVVRENGKIIRYVKEENTAWHAGRVVEPVWPMIHHGPNPNLYTLGVAFEGFAVPGPTARQVCGMAHLITHLTTRWHIKLDLLHIIPHNWIRKDKMCPGPHVSLLALTHLSGLRP